MGIGLFDTFTATPADTLVLIALSIAIGWAMAWVYASGR